MKYFALVSASALLVMAACSSKPTDPADDTSVDGGDDDVDALGDDTPAADGGKKDAANPPFDAGEASLPVDAGHDLQVACDAAAAALCDAYTRCGPFALEVGFGDVATCKRRTSIACIAKVTAKDSKTDLGWATGCAAAAPKLTCDQFVTQQLGACATRPGTRANGAACGDDDQCTSAFCARASGSVCGKCAPASANGSACVSGACSTGFLCKSDGKTCDKVIRGKANTACAGNEQCDLYNGVGCNPLGRCQTVSVAHKGEACGIDGALNLTVCAAAGSCGTNKKCAAGAEDGKACSDTADTTTGSNGPNCMGPAVCQGGVCALPAPNACN